MTRCACYARISYYDPDGDSLDSQHDLCGQYATDNGYEVIASLADHHVSGADMAAPELQRALDLARAGRIDVLVTRDLDRFARSLTKQLMKEFEFTEAGVAVEYVIGEYADTLEGQLVKHVRAIIAEFTRGKIAERLARGRLRSARAGNVMLAQNPSFGYNLVETVRKSGHVRRTLEINEEEAGWVRRIFQWYVYGDDDSPPLSYRKIAAKLTAFGVLSKWDKSQRGKARRSTPAGTWAGANIGRILTSRTYIGEWMFTQAGEEVVVPVPAIVDRDIWNRAQRRRVQARVRSRRNTRYEYLMRGRVVCASCGNRMHAHTTRKDDGAGQIREYGYYSCAGTYSGPDRTIRCAFGNHRRDHVDDAVWDALKALILNPDVLDATVRRLGTADRLDHLVRQLELKQHRLDELTAQLDRLYRLGIGGEYSQRVFDRQRRRLEDQLARVNSEHERLAMQMDSTTERLDRMQALKVLLAELRVGLAAADSDFMKRRQVIEILDVVVRLEYDGVHRHAFLEVNGEQMMTLDLPKSGHRRK